MRLLDRLPQETERSYALRVLKENIICLDLAPGSLISENDLSAQMGLSRTPVREALIELSQINIIKIVPQKRSAVAFIDYSMIEQASFMRNVLECAVIELVCKMATPDDLRRLDENVRLQNLYLESGNSEMLMTLDNQFHEILFEIAQKSQVYFMVQSMFIHFDRVRRMALDSVKDLKIVQDHIRILNAIRGQDAPEAKRLMEVHLNRYRDDAQEIREKYPQFMGK